jgi:hypothetical protein
MFEDLNDGNFIMFAMKHYSNPNCTNIDEFHDDIKRIRYIKRLFAKYKESGDLKERLVLNHLCILYNSFDHRAITKMLVMKISDHLECLKPFLILLNYWNTNFGTINGNVVLDSKISLDTKIVSILRKV